ncbi:response regulator [Geomonas sp. RF6]|uniref:response regulator n=1 Tax=Geomonas sp. RF6 TaxID=2897342 RepID=UPI001E511ED7|nr:response regulator [Geomonas sp. RF6]UFS72548.1 response regulator [Geomonas sp. RF6]
MKSLIVEDDKISGQVLEKMMSRHGSYDIVMNGKDAQLLFERALQSGERYDLVLMDIMVPEVDGLQAVLAIRKAEARMQIQLAERVKVIMTTALDDPRTIMKALYECDADSYLVKPIRLQKLEEELRTLGLF